MSASPFGLAVITDDCLEVGKILVIQPTGQVIVGIRPLTDVEETIRRITIEVFGEAFLRQIGAWQTTPEEVNVFLNRKNWKINV